MTPGADVVVLEGVWGHSLEVLEQRLRVRRVEVEMHADQLAEVLDGARAVVIRNRTLVTRQLLTGAPALQVIGRAGVGLDNIDVAAADELGVVVVAPMGANAVSVAEHALGLALALARGLVPLDRQTRDGGWTRVPGRELTGGCWGVLGAGATGRATARLARGLGMRLAAYDPYVSPQDDELASLGVRLMGLQDVARQADVISCHLPATPETLGVLDAAFFAAMRPGSFFVNVGRGEVVNEDALVEALTSGRLGGAALDVRATEPPVPGRLEDLRNVLLTPHVAGITAESQHRILHVLATDISAVLSGGEAKHAVGTARTARR